MMKRWIVAFALVAMPGFADWTKVKEWSGTSTKETEIFQVNSDEWRVNWTSSNDDLFSIIVRDDAGKTISVAANTLKAGSDTSYVHRARAILSQDYSREYQMVGVR